MADWATIASIGTAAGTLVLAIATYASVRQAKASAQASERALQAAIRPVLVGSRLEDPGEKVGFVDNHWVKVAGGRAVVEVTDDAIHLVIALRNAGAGAPALDRWDVHIDRPRDQSMVPTEQFRRLT